MAYRLTWWVENQVVLLSLQKESSLEDFAAFSREITTGYLNNDRAPVHVLLDMTRLEKFPYQIVRIRAAVSILFQHPSLGKIILVGRVNPLAACIIDTLARTFHVECVRAATMDEAYPLTSSRVTL